MFSSKVKERLGFYVYLYIDPRTKRPFYLGKGRGNRAFAHLKDAADTNKVKVINELKSLGLEPVVEILKYGLNEREAFLVESTAIDLLDLSELSNAVQGHALKHGHRATVDEIKTLFDAPKATILEPAVLININRQFRYGMSHQELYDATRSAWVVNPLRAGKAQLAFSVYLGVVRQVYEIASWLKGGAVMRASDPDGRHHREEDGRMEFVGQIAAERICKRYIGRSVRHYFPPGAQNPIRYVNC